MLTNSGLGDYWEDVERYARNHLFETQLLDIDRMRALSAHAPAHDTKRPQATTRDVLERSLGAFTKFIDPTISSAAGCGGCCLANNSQALYYVWDSILYFSGDTAQINLLLNRASPWLDVDSHVPFEGKVVIRNKVARRVLVRIPLWVDRGSLTCRVNDRSVVPAWMGRYVMLDSLKGHETIVVQFPLAETVETMECDGVKYTCTFKGNMLVDIHPRMPGLTKSAWLDSIGNAIVDIHPRMPQPGYSLYQRDTFRRGQAPITKVERFITSCRIQWQGMAP
jgi:hypothetical protein